MAQRRLPGETEPLAAVLLAAGQGTRMKSRLAKVLHPVAGRPMVAAVLRTLRVAGPSRIVVVLGFQADAVRAACESTFPPDDDEALLADDEAKEPASDLRFALQEKQMGTGHAVLQAEAQVADAATVLVMYGDTPLVRPEQLQQLIQAHAESGAAATLLTAEMADPTGYGRIVRGQAGEVVRIVEEADATAEERRIREINTGIGCFRRDSLFDALHRLEPRNAQGEFYLTDVVAWLRAAGQSVQALPADRPAETLGVNDRVALADANRALRLRRLDELMRSGVSVVDPASTFVDADAVIGRDTVLQPFTIIEGATRIGEDCVLGPHAHVRNSRLADRVVVRQSVVEDSELADDVRVGPFAHLRPGARVGARAEIGNYAEVKNTTVGADTKVHHHSYLGDAHIGARVNVGAGVVTVNYDGKHKHDSVVEDEAFLGCNANLVAPVVVGRGSYVAAGSTLTDAVPADALAIARARQVNKQGWARRRREDGQQEP